MRRGTAPIQRSGFWPHPCLRLLRIIYFSQATMIQTAAKLPYTVLERRNYLDPTLSKSRAENFPTSQPPLSIRYSARVTSCGVAACFNTANRSLHSAIFFGCSSKTCQIKTTLANPPTSGTNGQKNFWLLRLNSFHGNLWISAYTFLPNFSILGQAAFPISIARSSRWLIVRAKPASV